VVEDHKHCVVCGRAVAPDKYFCSTECENTFKQRQKQISRSRIFMLIFFIAIFVLFLLLSVRTPSG